MRPGMLKPAEQSVSRLDTGLDRQELLLQRTASAWCNLEASLPSRLAAGLDDLVGGGRIARERRENTKSENEPKAADGKKG